MSCNRVFYFNCKCLVAELRELSGIFTREDVLKLKGWLHAACVRTIMIYGSETKATSAEQQSGLESQMRRMRWMYEVSLTESKTSYELYKYARNRACVECYKK